MDLFSNQDTFLFRCLASGSSGNCYYLGTSERGILIDAGISARTIQRHLQEMGLDFPKIMAVLVTHDHADHIRAVGTLGERIHIPIYATATIHAGIDRNYGVQTKLRTCRHYFEKGVPFVIPTMPGMTINTFNVSHDSSECVGYVIDFLGQRFMIATDAGSTSEDMAAYIRSSQHIVIEANHDVDMLLGGPYPTYLKERILSPRGHQSNATCGQMLAENFHNGIRNIFLCHLSHENNDPEVAYNTVLQYLESVGAEVPQKVQLKALDRTSASPVYTLTPEK